MKVANPYNAHISNDPDDCKDHVPNNPSAAQQCKDYMVSNGGFHLFWDYNRYGDCNPQAEYCDMSLQPAAGFNIYTIKEGKAVLYSLHSLGLNYHYVPAMDQSDKDEYFVRAFSVSDGYAESGESNHVPFPQQVETTIEPISVETYRWTVKNYDGSAPQWYKAVVEPGKLMSGYAFTCLNNCSQGQYLDSWYSGSVKFGLPENMDIQNARLNWNHISYITSGPGANNVIMTCGVYLGFQNPDMQAISNTPLWGSENFDVSLPVLQARMKNQKSVVFSFVAPMSKKPGVRWDRCLWSINNLALTLHYYQ